jgi:putative MATE family efflux protein
MSQVVPARAAPVELDPAAAPRDPALLRQLLWLALPVLAEHVLHMVVGLTDTYLANHLPGDAAAATAAVGTVSYVLWFTGLMVGAIGTGSTAIIARAVGAKHRRLANSVCGQSVTAAAAFGAALGLLVYLAAEPIVRLTGLSPAGQGFALTYLRMLAISMPFSTVMFVANACLRGAGDTISPAAAMIVVDVVNVALSFGLTYGWWGLPEMGFRGIAAGTAVAYVVGGLIQFAVLVVGRGGVRLHLHRLRPHWHTLRRVLRIGIPSGAEGLLSWLAQFGVVIVINRLDPTSAWAAAHMNAIRIESVSYMAGFAVATAAATLVGQSLGRKDPRRAARAAYLSYAVGGGFMTFCGLLFILFAHVPAQWISADAHIAELTATCLFLAGWVQCGFAAAAIFSGALRGAGDTVAVMLINLASVILVRFAGVLVVALWFRAGGLAGIWMVLCAELVVRGALVYGRFLHGGWKHVEV